MTVAEEEETPALATTLPSDVAEKRDLLGNFCFYLHLAVMVYIVLGWLLPLRPALIFYLCFLPAVAVQWQFNKNSCVLNNLESFIRTGSWRDPHNKEEGAWLLTLATNVLGYPFKAWHIDAFTYSLFVVFLAAALSHLLWW